MERSLTAIDLIACVEKRGIPGGKRTCWATRILNDAFCKDSPFEIVLEETGDFSCRQVLRKKKEAAS